MKKLLVFVSVLTTSSSFSQQFLHAFGGTVSVLNSKFQNKDEYVGLEFVETEKILLSQYGATYFPRLNFPNGNTSISVGIPLSLGVGMVSDAGDETTGVYFSYDLPVVADF